MTTYLFYRRIRGPVFLLTFGVTALLAQWDILGFGQSWPLYLIVAGVLSLAERAAFAAAPTQPGPYAQTYPAVAGWQQPAPPSPQAGSVLGLATIPLSPSESAAREPGFAPVHEEER